MKKVVNYYLQLREQSKLFEGEVFEELNIEANQSPNDFFSRAYNCLTILVEQLSNYEVIWGKAIQIDDELVGELRQENAERVIMCQKMIFVEIMSALEFSLKYAFIISNSIFDEIDKREYLKPKPSRLYLMKVIEISHRKGIINAADMGLWTGVIRLRNSIVHNNAIAEETSTYDFPEVKLALEDKKMVQGDLLLFGHLTGWVLENAKKWMISSLVKI